MPTSMSVQVFRTSRNAGKNGMPEHLADQGTLMISNGAPPTGVTTVAVDLTKPRQTVVGFGAAITEAVASVVNALPADKQTEILNAYYGTDGSGYTLTRTHIGSCDFALSQYSYDDNNGQPDPTLANFSIAHDNQLLLPFLKRAIAASNGALRVLSSPWSAPGWMKDNGVMQGNGSDGSLLPQYYGAYASYLSKYIQAYKAAGVPIWAITPQNEALGVGGSREGMQWTPDQMNTFIKQNLGPQLMTDGVGDTKVFIYDHNAGPPGSDVVNWPTMMEKDTATSPFIAGTAVHWYGTTYETFDDSMDAIQNVDQSKQIIFTEGCDDALGDTGYGQSSASFKYSWMSDEFYWTKDEGDWGFWFIASSDPTKADHPKYEPFYRYTRQLIAGLNHWHVGFIDWNAVLNKDGGPGHIVNAVAAPVMVDQAANTVYYSPTYYALAHFSKYIRPNAQVLTTTVTLGPGVTPTDYDGMPTQDGNALMATAAKNTDNSVSIVLFNETNMAINYAVTLGTGSVSGMIPSQSLETLVWK